MSYLFSSRKKQHGDSIAPVKFSVSETFREMRIQGKRQDACVAGSNPRRWGKRGNSGRITLRAGRTIFHGRSDMAGPTIFRLLSIVARDLFIR